jgi:hypothetical protein
MAWPPERRAFRTLLTGVGLCWWALTARTAPPANDYPTAARVEYVQDCMRRNAGGLADLYRCSCAIDMLAKHLTYDEYVEAATFAHYASAPGEAAGIFRDTPRAKERAKLYRSLEVEAFRSCGLKTLARAAG